MNDGDPTADDPTADEAELGLRAAAEQLGVHYMTAYRYVRNGRLPAHKAGSEWRVRLGDLRVLMAPGSASGGDPSPVPRTVHRQRIEDRLLAADEAGVWSVVESALVSGADPDEVLLGLLSPAMVSIGGRWAGGELSIAEEHQASAVANRVIARLGPRFAHRGRKRADVVIGAVPGERHSLPTAIAADVLRGARYDVVDLGADTPLESFVEVASTRPRLLAVLLSVTLTDHLDAVPPTVRGLRAAVPDARVIVGGWAVDRATATRLGSDGWAGDARGLVALLDAMLAAGPGATLTPDAAGLAAVPV